MSQVLWTGNTETNAVSQDDLEIVTAVGMLAECQPGTYEKTPAAASTQGTQRPGPFLFDHPQMRKPFLFDHSQMRKRVPQRVVLPLFRVVHTDHAVLAANLSSQVASLP